MVKISAVKSERTHTKPVRAGNGYLKTTEPTVRGRTLHARDASQVPGPCVGQSRWEKLRAKPVKVEHSPELSPVWVTVISSTGTPLMRIGS